MFSFLQFLPTFIISFLLENSHFNRCKMISHCDFYFCISLMISGGGHGNPLKYSCLENPMERGAWWAIIHVVAKSQTWLKWVSTHMCITHYVEQTFTYLLAIHISSLENAYLVYFPIFELAHLLFCYCVVCCCSVIKLCPTICDPMNCSAASSPVLHYHPEFAQIHVRWVSDAI